MRAEFINLIENRRQILQKHQENTVQILCIPEKDIHGRQYHSDTDTEH